MLCNRFQCNNLSDQLHLCLMSPHDILAELPKFEVLNSHEIMWADHLLKKWQRSFFINPNT